MYAVIETGGKQYNVTEGTNLKVEKIQGEKGSEVMLERVLFIGGNKEPKIGTPTIEGVRIAAEIVRQGRGKKITIYKKKRRKGYEKKVGHRQPYTELKIKKIHA